MKKVIIISLIAFFMISSCNQSEKVDLSDPLNAAREFIDASLKGNYTKAKKYILSDSTNIMYFDRISSFYKTLNDDEKAGYKNANIIINPTETLSDSVTIINYSNTYKNKPSKLKMIRVNNSWFVDFKFSFHDKQ